SGANYHPFLPPAQTSTGSKTGLGAPLVQVMFGYAPTTFGVWGIFTAAAVVFFAFIGFDIVATAAEETRHPQRAVPRGILGSLAHPTFCTPYRSTMLLGTLVAVVAGFTSIAELSELVNIGTLFAFVVVAIGVMILRRTRPDLPRSFRTPLVPVIPVLSVFASL